MVEGIIYLLVTEGNRSEYVTRYTASEMIECFTADECIALTEVGYIQRRSTVIKNMVFAARALAA